MIVDSTYFVKIEYLNVTDSNTSYSYLLNGCPDINCPFDIFTKIYKPRFPAGPNVECTRKPSPMPPSCKYKFEFTSIKFILYLADGRLLLVLSIMIICLVAMIVFIFLCHYLRKNDRERLLIKGIQTSEFV